MKETSPKPGTKLPTKCTVIGDDDVGKSSLIAASLALYKAGDGELKMRDQEGFEGSHAVGTLNESETYILNVPIDKKHYPLSLFDTSGDESQDHSRPSLYPQTNVFLVCFSIAAPYSLEHVLEKWVPEIQLYDPDIRWVLVGLKTDLRGDILLEKELQLCHQKMVTKEHGKATAKALSTERYKVPYVECSASHGQNLQEVIDEIMVAGFAGPIGQKMNRKCTIL